MSFSLLCLNSYPIYNQLLLEEALLRGDHRNWCLINIGSPKAIILGISGKQEELIDCKRAQNDQIPLIRRFSGGGTVIVDEDTLFVTFVCNKSVHPFPPYPEPILQWSKEVYAAAFEHPDFRLCENDYTFKDKKCGGNAQYIKKERWLHHTSFLWDFSPYNMEYLLHPKKTPSYRQGRTHLDFLCRLKDYFSTPEEVIEKIIYSLSLRYALEHLHLDDVLKIPLERQSTQQIH